MHLAITSKWCLASAGEGLQQAQMNKLDDLIAQAGICATDHVLDIGFGWGSGAIRAVQTTGCRCDNQPVSSLLSLLNHLNISEHFV